MSEVLDTPRGVAQLVVAGRYAIFHAGRECGEERWRIESAGEGFVAWGEHLTEAPHPLPNRQEFRVALSERWRVTAVEILWEVGPRTLRATHAADGERWRVRVEYQGEVKEQEGDYPAFCEINHPSHLFDTFTLSRLGFEAGSEHECPVLLIGPPWMAVAPDRQRVRCLETRELETAFGRMRAKRYALSHPPRSEDEGYSFWADEHDVVLESCEGLDAARPWMKLVEYRRGR